MRPSVVIVRHPNQGDIIDIRFFDSPREAAREALALLDEGEDVELAIPQDGPEQGYRQVVYDEELEELAAGEH